MAIIQPGTGLFRDVVVLYHVVAPGAVRPVLWPDACVLGSHAGPYALVGAGDIEPLAEVVAGARRAAGPFSVRAVVLAGFGAGCRAVREQIREGARPDVTIALDGVSGPPGRIWPDEYYLGPWRVLADRARRGECLAVLTHTAQTYMEKLPGGQRYPSPIAMLREIAGCALPSLPPGASPVETRRGGLVVRSFPSEDHDPAAHAAQLTSAFAAIVAEVVLPWLAEMELPPTSLPRW